MRSVRLGARTGDAAEDEDQAPGGPRSDRRAASALVKAAAAGSPARYETRVGDNHHHLVCRTCGTVEDVECVVGSAPWLHAAADAAFPVEEAEITFWGQCERCRAA
jgi:Fe2+ or Zn2+ uptake regulation protein